LEYLWNSGDSVNSATSTSCHRGKDLELLFPYHCSSYFFGQLESGKKNMHMQQRSVRKALIAYKKFG
jgi:hypothetical protein